MKRLDSFNDQDSVIFIRQRLENKLSGRFVLYRSDEKNIDSELIVKQRDTDHINSTLSVRAPAEKDLTSSIEIKYRGNEEMNSSIEAVASNFLEGIIQVRPHNRLFGKFELHEAPRVEVNLSPLADATTRSRKDLETINYGDTRSMLTGTNDDEQFDSFISFGELLERIPDLKHIESAKLRLYYLSLPENSTIELHQPNTLWSEMGVTYANQPYSVELLSNQYTNNKRERYIEFNVLDIAQKWQSGELLNYGFIIKTSDNQVVSFFTRESDKSPQLTVRYITSQIYSIGQSQLDSFMFINAKGYKDFTGYLTVHSDVGFNWLESSLYVHRAKDPLIDEIDSELGITRAEISGGFTVAKRTFSDFDSLFTVASKKVYDVEGSMKINVPDLLSCLTIDPNATLKSLITVSRIDQDDFTNKILVSQQDIPGSITVTAHKKNFSDLDSTLSVNVFDFDSHESLIAISSQDVGGFISVRALGENDLDSEINVPFYSYQNSILFSSTPDLSSSFVVKYLKQVDAEIGVKERSFLDVGIDIKNITELSGSLIIKKTDETEADILINNPNLHSTLNVRAIGYADLNVLASIRKRDVSDLNSSILVKGASNGAYYFIL